MRIKKQISAWLRNTSTLATMVTLSTLATGIAAPEAFAIRLAGNIEGEVEVGLGCSDGCISLNPLIDSIESLPVPDSTGVPSRLFVDDLETANSYDGGAISFSAIDLGTNGEGIWFRPVNTNEGGQQEVGKYTFNFTKNLPWLDIDFLDVESNGGTGVLAVNGVDFDPAQYAPKLPDGDISTMTFEDVESITLNLGKVFANGAADGVNFRFRTIPEPSVVLGLGLVAATAGLGLRKRKNS